MEIETITADTAARATAARATVTVEGSMPRRIRSGTGAGEGIEAERLLGHSPKIEELRRLIDVVARSEATVLIQGETGTGKELVARAVHRASRRARAPFVVFNAANLPDQLFESELFGHARGAFTGAAGKRPGLAAAADHGTLFIDEVGEVALANQARLLRFLDTKEVRPVGSVQARKVDVRIVCATNRCLAQEVDRGRFRRDLYYRLRVLSLQTPPLRERAEDLQLLVQHFVRRFAVRHSRPSLQITLEARELLAANPWRGNVRELRNELERAAILTPLGQPIAVESLSAEVRSWAIPASLNGSGTRPTLEQRLYRSEREHVIRVLEEAAGDLHLAAEQLEISRSVLRHRLEKLNLDPEAFR